MALLRFEKQIAGLAATLAAGAVVAKGVDGKLHASNGGEAFAQMQSALVNLADVTAKAHEMMSVQAMQAGAQLLEAAGGGRPKPAASEAVRSILGIG
ncbi:hypothetical protein [Hyphococcus luteus]|uniref:hypothetical protein n=1 Tax=Hyphococcus luteus TaxID=2058213 RepID=UPI0010573C69|nr:hypothetical protein [Marinicaulis flavus]